MLKHNRVIACAISHNLLEHQGRSGGRSGGAMGQGGGGDSSKLKYKSSHIEKGRGRMEGD